MLKYICLDLCVILWYLLLRKVRWIRDTLIKSIHAPLKILSSRCGIDGKAFKRRIPSNMNTHTRLILRAHIALRNEYLSHARIPEAEGSGGQERRDVKGKTLRRTEETVGEAHRVHDWHILHLWTWYVHRRLQARHEDDDGCDEGRITAFDTHVSTYLFPLLVSKEKYKIKAHNCQSKSKSVYPYLPDFKLRLGIFLWVKETIEKSLAMMYNITYREWLAIVSILFPTDSIRTSVRWTMIFVC